MQALQSAPRKCAWSLPKSQDISVISHTFQQIAAHTYWLSPDSTTDRPVLGAIIGERATLLVDAGNSEAHAQLLLRELAQVSAAPPSFVALTHWHWDHVFGTAALHLPTFAHVETRRIVAEMATLDWSDAALDARVAAGLEIAFCRDMIKAELPDRSGLRIRPPEIGPSESVELDLGGVTCRIVHVGGDHAADSTVVYVPEDRIVFLGDCIYPAIYAPARHYTSAKLFPLLERLLAFDADCYLAGHHPAPMSRTDMQAEAALLQTIGRQVEQCGGDRAVILGALSSALGEPPNEDHLELVEEFLAGLELRD
jgi:glyoxylase-like metal-dependent hydrolase (beta-lactamase superfamily II)